MTMNYADAEVQGEFKKIPKGTLLFAQLIVKPYNLDQGLIEKPSKDPAKNWKGVDCDLRILGGGFDGTELRYEQITVEGGDVGVKIGRSQIRAILETGKGASSANPAGYSINSYADLHGLLVAIEIDDKPDYREPDDESKRRHCLGAYLSANPEGQFNKKFQQLLAQYKGTPPALPPVTAMESRAPAATTAAPAATTNAAAAPWESDTPADAEPPF